MVLRTLILIIIAATIFSGCSGSTPITPAEQISASFDRDCPGNHWNWGYWNFVFSADHETLDVIPARAGDYHFCVTKLLEVDPCSDCLHIGKPGVQGDGTVKLLVTIKHPFPGAPKYTGFDVRGMVYFPPTVNQPTWGADPVLPYRTRIKTPGSDLGVPLFEYGEMPLIFSRAADGGGELLNADGYSCYLIPGLEYSEVFPIYNYQPGMKGIEPTPQTTITPYKLFASDNNRRMFRVNDWLTREYHFALPPGEFCFGYAVDASWWPPDNLPVTNPATDFPLQANAEDPWLIEFEQVLPICEENVGKDFAKVTIHHRGTDFNWGAYIYAWDLSEIPYPGNQYQFKHRSTSFTQIDQFTSEVYIDLREPYWDDYGANGLAIPGNHFAILMVRTKGEWELSELSYIIKGQFVNLYIAE